MCSPPSFAFAYLQYDAYFPQFRSFDWFCGHSWSRGLLFAYDGKNEVHILPSQAAFYQLL